MATSDDGAVRVHQASDLTFRVDSTPGLGSESYLAEGLRLGHEGSWTFDRAEFTYWSPELFRMHGLDPSRKPPTVQEYLGCVHPQDRESVADLIKRLSAEASRFDATKRIVRPNGEVRYIRCVGIPVFENQSVKKYVGTALDVTDHEPVTQELRRREAIWQKPKASATQAASGGNPTRAKSSGQRKPLEFSGMTAQRNQR
jgi:PAS domain S-box-containing protein